MDLHMRSDAQDELSVDGMDTGDGGSAKQQHTKRTRVILSCAPCRNSKLKCDRLVPCSNCLKKERVDLCTYAPKPVRPSRALSSATTRLRRLEGMLRGMLEDDGGGGGTGGNDSGAMSKFGEAGDDSDGGGPNAARKDAEREQIRAEAATYLARATQAAAPSGMARPGDAGTNAEASAAAIAAEAAAAEVAMRKLDADRSSDGRQARVVHSKRGTTYVGATHFMVMLDDIESLKVYFDDNDTAGNGNGNYDDDDAADAVDDAPDGMFRADSAEMLLLGGPRSRPKAKLLACMPPRVEADRLIARYFASMPLSSHTLHRPTFAKKYSAFWLDPAATDMGFLAVLFMIMALGIHFSTFLGPHELQNDATSLTPVQRYKQYRLAASRALSTTGFANPSPTTIQSLLLFGEAEFLVNRRQDNCFLLLGMVVRLMLRMGLHRDPAKLPNLAAFEGEMRRRMWNLAIQLDLIVSFHLGLPGMIHGIPSDTRLPLNLLDDDFGPEDAVLPPARPSTEYTTMSYPIFKSMLCRVFGQVARLMHTLSPPTYAEVMRTDRLIEDKWHTQIPAHMKIRPLGDSVADPPMLIVQRFGLASLYQKSRCVLHRPYLAEPVPRPEHAYSRRVCLQAALKILSYQVAIHEATQPGGILSHVGWFITGLSIHDLLVGAVIVYLVAQSDTLLEGELVCTPPTPTPTPFTPATPPLAMTLAMSPDDGAYVTLPVDKRVLVGLLERSSQIWADTATAHPEVKKASNLLLAMLAKIHARKQHDCSGGGSSSNTVLNTGLSFGAGSTSDYPSRQLSAQPTSGPPLSNIASTNTVGMAMPWLFDQSLENVSLPKPGSGAALDQLSFQTALSRSDLVPRRTVPGQVPGSGGSGLYENGSGGGDVFHPMAPPPLSLNGVFDAWLPESLETVDWGTVDDALRTHDVQQTEWTDDAVVGDIQYAASGLWDHPDEALL